MSKDEDDPDNKLSSCYSNEPIIEIDKSCRETHDTTVDINAKSDSEQIYPKTEMTSDDISEALSRHMLLSEPSDGCNGRARKRKAFIPQRILVNGTL